MQSIDGHGHEPPLHSTDGGRRDWSLRTPACAAPLYDQPMNAGIRCPSMRSTDERRHELSLYAVNLVQHPVGDRCVPRAAVTRARLLAHKQALDLDLVAARGSVLGHRHCDGARWRVRCKERVHVRLRVGEARGEQRMVGAGKRRWGGQRQQRSGKGRLALQAKPTGSPSKANMLEGELASKANGQLQGQLAPCRGRANCVPKPGQRARTTVLCDVRPPHRGRPRSCSGSSAPTPPHLRHLPLLVTIQHQVAFACAATAARHRGAPHVLVGGSAKTTCLWKPCGAADAATTDHSKPPFPPRPSDLPSTRLRSSAGTWSVRGALCFRAVCSQRQYGQWAAMHPVRVRMRSRSLEHEQQIP
eukprot:364497-Chlamydomonas_euryale.AAC.2